MSSQLAATQKTRPGHAGTAQRQPQLSPFSSRRVSSRLESEQDLHERDTWESNKTNEGQGEWGRVRASDVAECQQ